MNEKLINEGLNLRLSTEMQSAFGAVEGCVPTLIYGVYAKKFWKGINCFLFKGSDEWEKKELMKEIPIDREKIGQNWVS